MKPTIVLTLLLILVHSIGVTAPADGPDDSLAISRVVELVLQNHPTVRQAQFNQAAAKERIGIERSDRYPDVSFEADYTRLGPVPQFELPGENVIKVAPNDNYDLHVGVRQTLYDFGRTDRAVALAESSQQSSADRIDLIKSDLAYRTMAICYRIMILHRQLDVLDEEIATLREHRAMSIKRLEAGTATDFDTLTIRVKIAEVEADRIDARHVLEAQEISLRELAGMPPTTPVKLAGDFSREGVGLREDSLVSAAMEQRQEMRLARDAAAVAAAKLNVVSVDNKPSLALELMAGVKNGYEPNLSQWRRNYAAGIQLQVPIFNGYKSKHESAAADAELKAAREHSGDVERQIRVDVRQALSAVRSSREKIASTETRVLQAEEAVSLASARYSAGVVTNLDLLDAETTLSQARLTHLAALYDLTVSLMSLDQATGRHGW